MSVTIQNLMEMERSAMRSNDMSNRSFLLAIRTLMQLGIESYEVAYLAVVDSIRVSKCNYRLVTRSAERS